MAFENGNNAFNYCEQEFLKYKRDKLIFVKVLQSLQYFQTRSDFPYCLDEVDFVFEKLLGTSLRSIAYWSSKYIIGFPDEMDWNVENVVVFENGNPNGIKSLCTELNESEIKELSSKFKDEYQAFLHTIKPLIEDLYFGESGNKKLAKVLRDSSFRSEFSIRLIRNDNEFFDIAISDEEIDKLCSSLSEMKNNK